MCTHIAKTHDTDTYLSYYISYIYIAILKNCVSLFCYVVFYSYLCIEKVSRSISKNTKVTSNKPKNSQKSSKILFKIQHKPSKMNQKPTFFHPKTPKMMLPFFELGESWRKTTPSVYQKHALTLQKMVQKCFKIHFFESKKHLIFAPSVLTNMLSIVKLQHSIWL